jgi:hypothetical protein
MDELLEIVMRGQDLARRDRPQDVCRDPRGDEPAGTCQAEGRSDAEGHARGVGEDETKPNDPVVDAYRRKLSMALF